MPRGINIGSAVTMDRILVGVCAAVWLVLLGASVTAVVALIDLGRGFQEEVGASHTGLLYSIIGVSAAIIVASVPVLVYSGRTSRARPPARRVSAAPRKPAQSGLGGGADHFGVEERKDTGQSTAVPSESVNRIWLRGTVTLVGVLGVALIPVAVATYAMAIGKDSGAWIGYVVAGVVTAAMPVIPWLYERSLRDLFAAYRA